MGDVLLKHRVGVSRLGTQLTMAIRYYQLFRNLIASRKQRQSRLLPTRPFSERSPTYKRLPTR
ncbi:MAG: hypothetical protein LBK82_11605 [Planctomycetaceae bacterium]|nr:hypothetical protein [Planctomycetaceae bacterium]